MKPDYLTPLTAEQRKDVSQLIMFTEANRRPLRKPRIRKRDPKTPPRPANCFLVYRREKQSQIAELCKGANHRVISKLVAKWWKEMDSVTKTIYVDVANQLKQEHTVKFPDYKYTPKRKNSHHHHQQQQQTRPAVIKKQKDESAVQPAGLMTASEQTETFFHPSATPSSFNTSSHDLNGIMSNNDLFLEPSHLFDSQTNVLPAAHCYDTNGISNLLLCQPVVNESFDRYLNPASFDTLDSFLGYPPPWIDYINQWPWFQAQQPIMSDIYTPVFEFPPPSPWSEHP